MKHMASLVGLMATALLGGCAVYPDGSPMAGNGYDGGYSGYEGYDGYATGVPVVPQTNVYMGYSNYSGPGYYNGPGRYYGPGPGYRGYPGYPGYPDRANFGRVEMGLSGEQIAETERALPGPGSNLTRKGSRRYGYFVSACLRSLSSLSTSSSLLITSASPFSSMRAVQE